MDEFAKPENGGGGSETTFVVKQEPGLAQEMRGVMRAKGEKVRVGVREKEIIYVLVDVGQKGAKRCEYRVYVRMREKGRPSPTKR